MNQSLEKTYPTLRVLSHYVKHQWGMCGQDYAGDQGMARITGISKSVIDRAGNF